MAEITQLPCGDAGGACEKKEGNIWAELGDESRLARNLPMYRKIRAIGRGAFGKAYLVETLRANQKGSGRQRVLKRLPLTGTTEEHREAAFREALLMRRISVNCPFITQFHEVFRAKLGTQLCIVMEFCSGGDLRNFLQQRRDADNQRLLEAEVLTLAAQMTLALHHVHGNGVLHRDVKPENCFFRSPGGDLLLGDFGISCSMDERSFAKTCIGSPLYLSPEIVNQERYAYSTDVWSLGVMLYEIAALQPPFKGANICQIAFRIVSATPEPLDEAAFSAPFRQLIDRMLDKNPNQRISIRDALQTDPLEGMAAAVSAQHGLPWPPLVSTTGVGRRGLVQRLRGHVATSGLAASGGGPAVATAPPGCAVPPAPLISIAEDCGVVYDDDFEAYDELEDEAADGDGQAWPESPSSPVYQDDFEEPSGSEDSYGEDFEDASDPEDEPGPADTEDLVCRWREELGEDGLVAESLGVVSFAMRLHSQGPVATAGRAR